MVGGVSALLGGLWTVEWAVTDSLTGLSGHLRGLFRGGAVVGAVLCALWLMSYGLLFGYVGLNASERVIERDGVKYVEVDAGFLEPLYEYYLYRGPLVRGRDCLEQTPSPWCGG